MDKFIGFVILLVVVLAFFVIAYGDKSNREAIDKWASKNKYEVLEVNHCTFDNGPYWLRNEGDQIYQVKLNNGRYFWFRFGLFGPDIEEYDR